MDAGDRIIAGAWPFRDWTGIYGPLLYAWGAGWYRWLGADWHAALLQLEVVSPVACLCLAALVAAWTLPSTGWRLLFLVAVAALGLDACYWAPALRVWFPLAMLGWAIAALRHGRRIRSGIACALVGLTPFVSPETGLAAVAACAVVILLGRPEDDPSATPRRTALFGLLAAPAIVALVIFPGIVIPYVRDTVALSRAANWIWGVPFPGPAYPWRRVLFLAPFALAAASLLLAGLGFLRRRERANPGGDLALALFASLVLRSMLGRTDIPHLLFALPPVLVLWFRLASRVSILPGLLAGILAVGCVIPYLGLSLVEGQAGRALRPFIPGSGPAPAVIERVLMDGDFAARLERILAAARPLAPAGRPVLSLPGPLYAHLLRRPNALPLAVPELLGASAASRALAALEASPPSMVIVDEAQALPWDETFLRSPARLTWSTPADEAIARELRSWLARRYRVAATVEGARLLVPRATPAHPPAERIVAVLAPTSAELDRLPRGDLASIPVPGVACDEIRLTVLCRYPHGLAGLAKSYVRVRAHARDGRILVGVLPVPPAGLNMELRIPVLPVPLVRIDLEVGSPGTFNPAPLSVAVPAIRLVGYTGAR
jgi:hypothetical protein